MENEFNQVAIQRTASGNSEDTSSPNISGNSEDTSSPNTPSSVTFHYSLNVHDNRQFTNVVEYHEQRGEQSIPAGCQQNPVEELPVRVDKIHPTSSIHQIREPISHFKETETFCKISDSIKTHSVWILQCYGVPGSGKSQTVLNLAKNFPFVENVSSVDTKQYVKWHIQCSDSRHDVKQELQNLAEELQRQSFIANHDYYSINDALENGSAGPLVNSLVKCEAHVLIVIEDPDDKIDNNKNILSDLCRQLNAKANDARQCKFHLYVTSRKMQQIISEEEMKKMSIYQPQLVKGFGEREAVEFLNEAQECATSEEAAVKMYKKFGGLPLGLQAARGYCKDSMIEYDDYLSLVQEKEDHFVENDNENLLQEFGSFAKPVFQAIVMPFKPSADALGPTTLHWKILSCLSYFHHDCVPKFLFERCCYILCDHATRKSVITVRAITGRLIKKLIEYGMCIKTDQDEIIFHQVVFNAFRYEHVSSNDNSKSDYLKKAIEILCSVVSKDLRKKESVKMIKFRPHLQSLLDHVGEINQTFKNDTNSVLLAASLSHLYEITATLMSGESHAFNAQCDKYFLKAIELLWQERKEFTDSVFDPNVDNLSKEIVDLSKSKGLQLPENFVINHYSKLCYCFNDEELKTICKGKWQNVKTTFETHGPKDDLIRQLQVCDLFLEPNNYRSVFYAERYASILHSWSRAIVYAEPEKVERDTKSAWMSSLSRSVAMQCRLQCGVSLLSEWLTTRGLISIWLKQKKGENYLDEVMRLCNDALSTPRKMTMHENGIVKEVIDTRHLNPFSRISILKGLVRVYSRQANLYDHDCAESDNKCEELFKLAKDNASEYQNSPTCMVYCAKYYSARGKFDKALECFRNYFVMISEHGRNHQPKFVGKCWAVYNYARSIACHPSPPAEERDRAVRKCEELLSTNDVMERSLNRRMKDELQKLIGQQNEREHEA